MRNSKLLKTSLAAAALMAFAPTAAHATDPGVRVGMLECNVDAGWGHVIASDRDVDCVFRPVDGRSEHYRGSLRRYGLDLGYTDGGALIWAVIAPTSEVERGALEGDYAGASAQVTPGVGLGANVLVGGFDKSIVLQPISVEGNTGIALAAGVGVMILREA